MKWSIVDLVLHDLLSLKFLRELRRVSGELLAENILKFPSRRAEHHSPEISQVRVKESESDHMPEMARPQICGISHVHWELTLRKSLPEASVGVVFPYKMLQ